MFREFVRKIITYLRGGHERVIPVDRRDDVFEPPHVEREEGVVAAPAPAPVSPPTSQAIISASTMGADLGPSWAACLYGSLDPDEMEYIRAMRMGGENLVDNSEQIG